MLKHLNLAPFGSVPGFRVLSYLLRENRAEITGMVASFNAWCDSQPDLDSGTPLRTDPDTLSAHPKLGEFSFESRGTTFHMQTLASVLYTYQRALDEINKLEGVAGKRIAQTISESDGAWLIGTRAKHRIRLQGDQYSIE